MKIYKGKRYLCKKNYTSEGGFAYLYLSGRTYLSEMDGCITDERGERDVKWYDDAIPEYFEEIANGVETETRPSHYGGDENPHEPIKIIQHYNLSFELGNVIKYVLRSDKKGQREADLKKAMQYLQFELNKLNK